MGENSFEINERVTRLVAEYEGEVERLDGSELAPEQLPDLLSGITLFSTKRLIVLKHASQNKLVWTALGEWLERGITNDLALVETTLDKRTKIFKWLQKNAKTVEAKNLQPHEAVRWLIQLNKPSVDKTTKEQSSFEIERDVAEYLVEYVGTDQWRLSNELTKLKLSKQKITLELVREIAEPTLQATSFELLDAAFARNRDRLEKSFSVVSRNEDAHMFFGLLASQIYALALMCSAGSRRNDEVAKSSGVHPYVLQKITPLAHATSHEQLRDLVGRLAELDEHLKSRPVDPWVQIHSFLLQI